MELWEASYLDMMEPAYILFDDRAGSEVELVAHMGFSAAVAEDLANGMIVVVAGEGLEPPTRGL